MAADESQRQANPDREAQDGAVDGEFDAESQEDGASGGAAQQGQQDDPVALREALRQARREQNRLARRLKEMEPATRQAQSAEERATAAERERERLATELREERATRQIMAAAQRAGAVDPEDVADLILRRGLVEFDGEGRPVDLPDAIGDLQRNKPHLFAQQRRAPDADAGRGNSRRESEQVPDFNTAFRRVAGAQRR